MAAILSLLLAGTVVSTAIKVWILVVGVKTYRKRRQRGGSPAAAVRWPAKQKVWFTQSMFPRRHPASAPGAHRLIMWAQVALPRDDALHPWLTSLSAAESKALSEAVTSFCALRQFELAWLFDSQLVCFPELQAQLGEVVLNYCRAQQAAQFAIHCVQRYQLHMALSGFFVRGAMSLGPICLTDEIIFGSSLIESYVLESKTSIVPRVILTPHSAFYSVEAFNEMRVKGALEARRVIQGEPVRNPVNLHVLQNPRAVVR